MSVDGNTERGSLDAWATLVAAELGMGTGWMREEHEAYGFPFMTQGERTAQLEEQLQVVAGTWAEAPFSYDGERYTLRGLDVLKLFARLAG